jgi:Mg2+-importing ATPase
LSVGRGGLTGTEARRRLAEHGPNTIEGPRGHRGWRLFVAQVENPIILVLIAATVVSMLLGATVDGAIILGIVLASGALGFWQEHRAGSAVDSLVAQIRVATEVRRDGRELSVPIDEVVPGDVVVLRAGDLVPGDARLLVTDGLVVDQAVLTGESSPDDKWAGVLAETTELGARINCVFMGTHIVSGTGDAVVVHTGANTEFGALTSSLSGADVTTGFERGMASFGRMLVKVVAVLVVALFAVNVVLNRPWSESFLFSLALAVGLTPQLLPAIVSVSLANGARLMARQKVIVRRLDAIEDIGAMSVLCTDKTGTLTEGAVRLDRAIALDGEDDAEVLRLAALNASLQRHTSNAIDEAIVRAGGRPVGILLDEIPYDFTRKRLGVLVHDGATTVLVVKGAVEQVIAVCSRARARGSDVPLSAMESRVRDQFAQLSAEGYRVLAVATKDLPGATTTGVGDERDMVLRGLLAFHDPPKAGVVAAIGRLKGLGVRIVLVTGDNRLAAAHIAGAVGLDASTVLTGADIVAMDNNELAARCATVDVVAEVEPLHKQRVVAALRNAGETVGFLGDGINDAVALHDADVGISVDTAVDAAKQTAALVLLDKSLSVVADGVLLGRSTFANTLTYIRVTVSANFGNMLSMGAASVFLPFLPLLPRQILLLNVLSDVPAMAVASDRVDPELVERPRSWDVREIRNAMLVFGAVSSVFDVATFVVLRGAFGADATTFRSAWFVESLMTEVVALLVLRTRRPVFRSLPGRALVWASAAVVVVGIVLPASPLALALGMQGLAAPVIGSLVALTVGYAITNELVKAILTKRR